MNIVPINIATPLRFQIKDGSSSAFIRAGIYDVANVFLSFANLSHVANGMYVATHTFTALGYYNVAYAVYTDGTYSAFDPYYELDSETYSVEASATPNSIAEAVWDLPLAARTVPNSGAVYLKEIINLLETGATPEAIANAVWEEAVVLHTNPGTYGLYIDVIREYCAGITGEVTSPVSGLFKLKQDISDARLAIVNEVNQNEIKIDAIPGYISSSTDTMVTEINQNEVKLDNITTQSVLNKNEILAEILIAESKIDSTKVAVNALSNNTTVRFIVPEQLVRPDTGTKTYQFMLRLFDDLGNPESPDTAPTITVKDLAAGGTVINSGTMSQDGVKVGAYFYDYNLVSGSPTHQLVVEATIVEGGVTRYIPATTEITEFSSDLNAIQAQLVSVDSKVSDTQNKVNNPIFGLSAIKTLEDVIISEINQNETKIDSIILKTNLIPNNIATSVDVAAVTTAVYTRPDISEIIDVLDILKSYLVGPDGRNNTDVYNRFNISSLLASNDPRLNNLDAKISTRSTLVASEVWDNATRTLSTFTLPTIEVQKIWDHLTNTMGTLGSIGKLIKDYLDVAVSSRATQAQVQSLLGGVAQESSIQNLLAQTITEINQNEVKLNTVISLLNLVKPKTDLIVNGGAKETTVVSEADSITALISSLQLISNGIKAKTDTIPVGPAKESSVLAIPKTPLLASDNRLNMLDAPISSRSTLGLSNIAPLAKTIDVVNSTATMLSSDASLASALNSIAHSINQLPITDHVDFMFSSMASHAQLEAVEETILAAIGGIGSGSGGSLTAADVWNYATRIVTINTAQYNNLAKNTDSFSYSTKMSTVYQSGVQELIVWAERNGSRYIGTNCTVTIKDANGVVKWADTIATPNADGIFKFSNAITATPNSNYYAVISVVVDGAPRITNQSFFTVG